MMKHLGTFITLLVLPVMLFALIYFGMRLLEPIIEPTPKSTETSAGTPSEPSLTCGNGICEKIERDEQSCTEDC